MGRRGPKPQSANVKRQKGNPGRRPLGLDATAEEVKSTLKTAELVSPPSWLKGDGLKIWKRLATLLIGQNILTQIDAEAFGRYCQHYGRWLKMQKALDEQGETYETESPHGTYLRANPAFMISARLDKMLETAEANFGLTPADRQRLFAARAAGSLGGLFEGGQSKSQPDTGVTSDKISATGFLLN